MNRSLRLEAATLSGSPGPAAPPTTEAPSGPVTNIFASEIKDAFARAREGADRQPFPSPTDWRDCWMYFLIIDRFANPDKAPASKWDERYDYRQGGTFTGVIDKLDYLQELGVKALWLSPILKNPRPNWQYNYHGYDTQDFLNIDERFGSDGTLATAERELDELVAKAHGRGMYVVLDIILNHTARVFDYVYQGRVEDQFDGSKLLGLPPWSSEAPLGDEPPIQWMKGDGSPQADWWNQIPSGTNLSPDDAVYPRDLQKNTFFRRRGDNPKYIMSPEGFVKGDFGQQRQLVVEYDATPPSLADIRAKYGITPVLNILIRAYQYLIARFDFDGFRIDTAKHVSPAAIEVFGNAIREFAQTLGKRNFFTFGEIYSDDEKLINQFVGRHTRIINQFVGGQTDSTDETGVGIDAALDYPLFGKFPGVVRSQLDVGELPRIFEKRKDVEKKLISSHAEAGQYFVTFLDNHDQPERFNQPWTSQEQVTMGLAILFCLQGIPAVYYGTEQGLQGTVHKSAVHYEQNVREALWGMPDPFNTKKHFYIHIRELSRLREEQAALRYGRLYFRQVSGNGRDFGPSSGVGGLVAFSRVLSNIEVLVVANTHTQTPFDGLVMQDHYLNRKPRRMLVRYSNLGTNGSATVTSGDVSALPVKLAPMEVKVWVPEPPIPL
jgi:glycosidase